MRINRSGFSLVLSLTIMAAMVMMVIVLASFLQVESRLAQSNAGYLRARFNALASARIAIAQLQVMAGPDQRVTMRADMYGPEVNPPSGSSVPAIPRTGGAGAIYNPSAPTPAQVAHQKRYLTGVWATGGVNSSKVRDWNVSDPHATRLFLGWLCSPMTVPLADGETPDPATLPNFVPNRNYYDATGKVRDPLTYDGQRLINDLATPMSNTPQTNLVPLVSSGSVSWPTSANNRTLQEYHGAIDLRPAPTPGPTSTRSLGANGRYAFWVGDEGLKAKINLPDVYAKTSGGATFSGLSNWEKGLGGSAAQRSAIETIRQADRSTLPATFPADFVTWRNADIQNANAATGTSDSLLMGKIFNPTGLTLWAARQGGGATAGQTMSDAMRALRHDVTPWSFSTLTDTYSGGLKMDLSTAFELPYATYRGLELYPDQKNITATTSNNRRQSLFHAAPGFADLDFNRPNLVDKIASPQDLLAAYPRVSEWAPRYLASLLGPTYLQLKQQQNAGETPERMGFVYEAPISDRFFKQTNSLVSGTSISRLDTTRTNPLPNNPVTPVRVHSLPWSELDENNPENFKGRIVRGPTWDLYRNYYRMYKREIEAVNDQAPTTGLMGQVKVGDGNTIVARGLEPLTFASGNRVTPLSKGTNAAGQRKKYDLWPKLGTGDDPLQPEERFYESGSVDYTDFFYRNNFSDTTFGPDFQAEKRIFQPFNIANPGTADRPGLGAQTINTFWSAGGINNITPGVIATYERSGRSRPTATTAPVADSFYDLPTGSPGWQAAPRYDSITTNTTTRTWPTAMNIAPSVIRFSMVYSTVWNQDMLGVVVDPYITLHNPYDCPIEFEGIAMVSNDQSMTYYFEFEVGGNAPGDFSSSRYVIGDVTLSQSFTDGRELSFRAVAGQNGSTTRRPRVFRLEPGEVRIMSPSQARRRSDLIGTSSVAVPGDLVFEQQSRMFFPMTPYVGMSRLLRNSGNIVVLCEEFTDEQIAAESPGWDSGNQGAMNNKWWMENARRVARSIKMDIPGWNGNIPSLNSELFRIGRKPFIKFRNFGWTNWSGYIVNGLPRPSSGTSGMDGNLHYNFYLLNRNSAKELRPLNWERRWSGSRDLKRMSNSYRQGEDTPHGWWAVDQPLLLNLQTLSAGWPAFGNSNRGFVTDPDDRWSNPADTWDFRVKAFGNWGPRSRNFPNPGASDPEFDATSLIYYDNLANSVNEGQFQKLPVQGPAGDNFATWEAAGSNVFKNPVLLFDMLVRGSRESAASNNKWYPSGWSQYRSGVSDASPDNRLRTPTEMRNAPMTPFFSSTRAQQAYLFGYDGKAHGPVGWITRQVPLTSPVMPIDLNGDNAFWGTSVDASGGGQNNVVLFPIPRRPLLSLSQLGSAGFAQTNTDPDFTVGSSFAHPGIIDLSKIVDWPGPKELTAAERAALTATGQSAYWIPEHGYAGKSMGEGMIRNRSNVRTDHAFAANLTLWDTYYFSGLNLTAASYSSQAGTGNWPAGPNLPIDTVIKADQEAYLQTQGVADPSSFASLKIALDAGRMPLANKRLSYTPDFKPASTTFPKFDEFPHPAFLASRSMYSGGFNVNSTSKAAWKAVLAGLKGQILPNATGAGNLTALTKFAQAFDPAGSGRTRPWSSHRELSDNEIDALAAAVVEEVRRRGPFMSLGDFVNRRLLNDDAFGLKGALQAAIDATDKPGSTAPLNNNAITAGGGRFSSPVALDTRNFTSLTAQRIQNYPTVNPWPEVPNVDRFPSLRAMSNTNDRTLVTAALGAPGIVTQMDVLNSIGPNLTVRTDTFVVRAYGEALDKAGNTIGKAWVEVVVQRTPEYVGRAGVDPNRRKLATRGLDADIGSGKDETDPKKLYENPLLENFELRPVSPTASAREISINRIFGRRFKPVYMRWLSASEI